MFKRVEKKRKKREEEEELGLDEDMKEVMGLNDTDTDESDSDSDSESNANSGESGQENSEAGMGQAGEGDEEDGSASEEDVEEEPPMSVAEALKNPLYLISLDPTIHGCILCKGKAIKHAEMAAVHKNATAHKRRFERFKALALKADQEGDAWDVVKEAQLQANGPRPEPENLSNRALKRRSKQASIREKRKRHKELKAKAMAKKTSHKSPESGKAQDEAPPPTKSLKPTASPGQLEKPRKKRKVDQKAPTGAPVVAEEAKLRPVRPAPPKPAGPRKSSTKSNQHRPTEGKNPGGNRRK
ncbi:hypothetical protein HYDPIDRAFT_108891 [Hydnomerulius pinastri MD-312]|nr:hypothetical protein HYDPIDRAFT_108891 [Hydnomerulius pinastri MD-312]